MSSILSIAPFLSRLTSAALSHQSVQGTFNFGETSRLLPQSQLVITLLCALLFAALLITFYKWWALKKATQSMHSPGAATTEMSPAGSYVPIEELKRSEKEIRSFCTLFIDAEEEERMRVARKLHDDLSQDITIIVMELAKLDAQFENHPGVSELTQNIELRARHLATELNTLSHQLHPPHLEILGLPSAIRAFCNESRARGITISLKQEHWPSKVPSNVALCLYRVLQETVGYITQTGKSEKCSVELTSEENNNIVMRIADGTIFHLGEERNSNVSWIRIRERVRMVNGELRLLPTKEKSTILEIKIPTSATSAAA